ncbi:MAG: acyl-CoA dehydrogenase C-terminal domain-containing protein, partial [Ornithinimicrobium sp.]
LNTTRVLMALGDVVCAWLLLRQADVALTALAGDAGRDQRFYEGKVAAAQFFCQQQLPRLSAERAVVEATDSALMELDEAAF